MNGAVHTAKLKLLFAALDRESTPFEARVRTARRVPGVSKVVIMAQSAAAARHFDELLRQIKISLYELR